MIDGLFQGPGVRTSGFFIIGMTDIAPALLVVNTGAMYISGFPIIISIRSSNVYEEKSLGIDAPEPTDDVNESERTFIGVSIIPRHFIKEYRPIHLDPLVKAARLRWLVG